MASIGRSMLGTLRLQDDMLKQACDRIKELENELALAHAHITFLELKLMRRPKLVTDENLPALLRPQI